MNQDFRNEARKILDLKIAYRVNANGGYGPNKEVIYESHPFGSPAILTDKKGNATASFYSNGSIDFGVKVKNFSEVKILDSNFDKMDKREINVPSHNVWIEIDGKISSLINSEVGFFLKPGEIKIVKINQPNQEMWYCSKFYSEDFNIETAVKVSLSNNEFGPILKREIYVGNNNGKKLEGNVWLFFNLPSEMENTWDRDIWYNRGIPLDDDNNIVIASTVPHKKSLQIKQIHSTYYGDIQFVEATCDYLSFIGHSAASSFLPMAVQQGTILRRGARSRMNRFSSPTIAANHYKIDIAQKSYCVIQQNLLYVVHEEIINEFRDIIQSDSVNFNEVEKSFIQASKLLVNKIGVDLFTNRNINSNISLDNKFMLKLKLPSNPELEVFFDSICKNILHLYNRSYGRKIADGTEIGMRDKAQDMWPMIKENPSIVRKDLIHKFSMMYTVPEFSNSTTTPMTLTEKLHGMFPRQYPSKWTDRTKKIKNDNRPFSDSALWPIETLFKYIKETGDYTILKEEISTSTLTDFEDPVNAEMVGVKNKLIIFEIINEIFNSYIRHIKDSPYGMAQILYGDWADPIEMIGTSIPGDTTSRGKGRGTSIRLSAHLFIVMIMYLDFLQDDRTKELFYDYNLENRISKLSKVANNLRKNTIFFGWEETKQSNTTGFISFIHEFKIDGTLPDYKNGEIGYTIGSMCNKDFDRINRRELLANAFGLEMLMIEKDYLESVENKEKKIKSIIEMTDNLLSDEILGVKLFSYSIANNENAIKYCGRIGMIGPGCSENGEYHHAASMMQYFRFGIPGQVNFAWKYYKPLLSVYRNEYLNGPFDSFANSYVSDPEDPHFSAGMIFGFSGTLDWAIEIIERIIGLELNLYSSNLPDVIINPKIPDELNNSLEFTMIIHLFIDEEFSRIPIRIKVEKCKGNSQCGIWINDKKVQKAVINDIKKMEMIDVLFIINGIK